MTVTVKYFAIFREKLGRAEDKFEISALASASIRGVWQRMLEDAPNFDGRERFVRFAKNHEFVDIDTEIESGDEVAFIPPVSGGSGRFFVTSKPLVVSDVVEIVRRPDAGAVITFEGVVRNHTGDRKVDHLEYEIYEEMALAKLAEVAESVETQFDDVLIAIAHRFGRLEIGEASIVIAVSSPHRKDAFSAAEFTIDRLKEEVPIWKKEVSPDGDIWVGWGS